MFGECLLQYNEFGTVKSKSLAAGVSEVHELSVSQLYQREPRLAPGAVGALSIPGEAVTDPWLFPTMLAAHARLQGALIQCGSRVESLSRDQGTWKVQTTTGIYIERRASSIVLVFMGIKWTLWLEENHSSKTCL